ncbi:MAG: hypothetical protein EXS16_19020 [Gemmataceae bacterium]|nr:hypothetical protein [Gemmataceae bacterium]
MKQMFLTICGLVLLWAIAGASGAQSNVPVLPEAHKPREVKAFGVDAIKAREIAVNQATILVGKLLEENNHTSFKPDKKYVRENLLVDDGKPGPDERNEVFGEQPLKGWIVTFKDSNWWQDIVRRDYEAQRVQRSAARQSDAKRFAVALLVVLAIAHAYIRCNRMTRGRYARWLQAICVGVASVLLAIAMVALAGR